MTPLEGMYSGPRVLVRGGHPQLATTFQLVAPQKLAWSAANNFWPTGATVKVVSASANDTAAGTGMRTIRIFGAAVGGTFRVEDVPMAGATAVVLKNKFAMIYGAYGVAFGSGGANAGAVYVYETDRTAATENALAIPAGENTAYAANYMVPPGGRYVINEIRAAACTQVVIVSVKIYDGNKQAWFTVPALPVGNMGFWRMPFPHGIGLVGGDAVRVEARSVAANGVATVELELV